MIMLSDFARKRNCSEIISKSFSISNITLILGEVEGLPSPICGVLHLLIQYLRKNKVFITFAFHDFFQSIKQRFCICNEQIFEYSFISFSAEKRVTCKTHKIYLGLVLFTFSCSQSQVPLYFHSL